MDHLIVEQTDKIQAEIASSTQLVSVRQPLQQLEQDFANDERFRCSYYCSSSWSYWTSPVTVS